MSRPAAVPRAAPLLRAPVRFLDGPNGPLPSFVTPDEINVDAATVAAFGHEWTRFGEFSDAEVDELGRPYFADLLPDDRLRGARVLDAGCGSGRWTRYVARRADFVEAADPSAAALVAARATAHCGNVRVIQASIAGLPYEAASFDIVASVGVVHHLPDPDAAIERLAELLRPGGWLFLYLYYNLEGEPWTLRAGLALAQPIRAIVSRLPPRAKIAASEGAAVTISWPLVTLARLVRRLAPGRRLEEFVPLHTYADRSWTVIRNDALDRFGTPLERRFSKPQIAAMLERTGLCDIRFSESRPRWRVIARRR